MDGWVDAWIAGGMKGVEGGRDRRQEGWKDGWNRKETKKGVLQYRRELQHFAIYKHRPWPILKFEFLMGSRMFSDYFLKNYYMI